MIHAAKEAKVRELADHAAGEEAGQASGYRPVERVPAAAGGRRDVLLLCDHATNIEPPGIALGLGPAEMARHIAWDVGARAVTLAMADALGAGAVLSRFSRLVIDPNRGEDDPTLVMKLYDGTLIPGNRTADAAEVARRLELYHRPYHRAVAEALRAIEADGHVPKIVSLHSFTPQLIGRPSRPWHVGLLWDRDDRLVAPLFAALDDERLADGTPLVVGDNEPYTGALTNDCLNRHGTAAGRPHVLIELRSDLIACDAEAAAWGRRMAGAVARALDAMGPV